MFTGIVVYLACGYDRVFCQIWGFFPEEWRLVIPFFLLPDQESLA